MDLQFFLQREGFRFVKRFTHNVWYFEEVNTLNSAVSCWKCTSLWQIDAIYNDVSFQHLPM